MKTAFDDLKTALNKLVDVDRCNMIAGNEKAREASASSHLLWGQ